MEIKNCTEITEILNHRKQIRDLEEQLIEKHAPLKVGQVILDGKVMVTRVDVIAVLEDCVGFHFHGKRLRNGSPHGEEIVVHFDHYDGAYVYAKL